MSSITLHELYNCGVKVWVCVGAMNCERVHYCACVSECIGGPRWGRETAGVRVWECVFVRVLECRRDTWLMLWTRLRDSVSVLPSSLLQPQTHAGTHTTSFSLSFILFFSLLYLILWLLSQIIHEFFFISQILFLTQLRRHCTCVLLSIYYMLSNCCHYCDPPPPFCVSPETTSHANSRHGGTLLSVLSTLLYEIDKCIGYWLSPMSTSTSIHCFPGPLHCPLSTSCPAGAGVSLAGLGARQATSGLWRAAAPRPSPCSLAPAGVSSGSSACQSDLTPTEREKKQAAGSRDFHFVNYRQRCKQMNWHWILISA